MSLGISQLLNFACPSCLSSSKIVRDGSFFRKSDGKSVQRYRCSCGKRFSSANFDPAYRQNKRKVNFQLAKLLSSGVSLRRSALILNVARKTIERKLRFLGQQAKLKNENFQRIYNLVEDFQFDDLETIEHTKCKPLSVTLAVESKTRKILGFEVSQMPAKGHLAKISRRKYGYRKDHRKEGIHKLMETVQKMSVSYVKISSDAHPLYPPAIKKYFPDAEHFKTKGARGCVVGQGELKKLRYDPLFYLNHTCAMLRANINRLIRKTWCTTKDPSRLVDHLHIYMQFHNQILTSKC